MIKNLNKKICIMIIIIFAIVCISNIVLAEKSGEYGDKWDDFYNYFMGQMEADGGKNLTDDEIDRMIAGATDEERQDGSLNWEDRHMKN